MKTPSINESMELQERLLGMVDDLRQVPTLENRTIALLEEAARMINVYRLRCLELQEIKDEHRAY